jgi:hypothetical protein
MAPRMDASELRGLRGDLMHPGIGLLILVLITILNIFKPAGVTPYGWRKQREHRMIRTDVGSLGAFPLP